MRTFHDSNAASEAEVARSLKLRENGPGAGDDGNACGRCENRPETESQRATR
jgi:hypothetical protein